MIQAIARKVQKLPVTLLELNTIAQVWIALVLYVLWWHKPKDMEYQVVIDFSHCEKCRDNLHRNDIDEIFASENDSDIPGPAPSNSLMYRVILLATGGYITIDALGWHSYFVTQAEMIMWRISVVIFAGVLGV